MLEFIRRRRAHLAMLWKEGLWGKWIGVLWAAWWPVLAGIRDETGIASNPDDFKAYKLAQMVSLQQWAVVMLALFAVWIFEASLRSSKRLAEQIAEMGKVDSEDLERMLVGSYIDRRTFFYNFEGADINLVTRFEGRLDFLRLKHVATIKVRAPKHSWARISFLFSSGGGDPHDKYYFYVLDREGREKRIENIYEDQDILLDEHGSFKLGFKFDEHSYVIRDHPSLILSLVCWTK